MSQYEVFSNPNLLSYLAKHLHHPSCTITQEEEVDVVYSDIAQPDQARILSENIDMYLKDNGEFLMAIKARSVDVSKDPAAIFAQERQFLESKQHVIREMIRLEPFEVDHCMLTGSK